MKRANLILLGVIAVVLVLLLWGLLAVELTLRPEAYHAAARSTSPGGNATTTATAAPAIIAPPAPSPSATDGASTDATATALAGEPPKDTATAVPLAAGITTTPRARRTTATPTPSPIRLPGRFLAVDYRPGGDGVGYHDSTQGNAGETYRADDVDIETCSDGTLCYGIGWIVGGEWLAYNVQVAQTDRYLFRVLVSSPRRGARFHIEVDRVNVTGSLPVPRTGSYQEWEEAVSGPVRLSAGRHTLRFVAETDSFNLRSVRVTRSSAPRSTATPSRRGR
ncbi:MAG: carbohydrate-binding protein [Chloroflexota bacterium]|nr:carbohydrate-binding protein [Chloroflexota bacterium]